MGFPAFQLVSKPNFLTVIGTDISFMFGWKWFVSNAEALLWIFSSVCWALSLGLVPFDTSPKGVYESKQGKQLPTCNAVLERKFDEQVKDFRKPSKWSDFVWCEGCWFHIFFVICTCFTDT